MIVHKGGQINNVQLITGVRTAEMSQLQNWSVKIFKERSSRYIIRKRNGGRIEVIVKITKKVCVCGGGGGGVEVIVKMQKMQKSQGERWLN